jgi:hypothetical protein
MTFGNFNYVAILITGIAGFLIGALWYSPVLFGHQWMKLTGMTEKKMKAMKKNSNMGLIMLVGFLATLLTAFILANFIGFLGTGGPYRGLEIGFWVWLGFVFPVQLGMVLWEGKSVSLLALNTSHQLVMLIVMGAMLGAWA